MKKLFLFITTMFFFIQFVIAQNVAPYWSTSGNSNATNASKLGTTNSIPLKFFTNNKQRMVIVASGNIGIGTTSPQTKFHLSDQTKVPSFAGINNAGLRIQGFNSPGNFALLGFSGYSDSYSGNLAQIGAQFTNSGSSLSFGTSNNYATGVTNTAMTIDYNGNVGIGTTTSISRLHVVSTAGKALYAESPSEGIYGRGTGANGTGVTGVGVVQGLYGYGGTYGVYGKADVSYGVYGTSPDNGVYGEGLKGVFGKSTLSGGNGVRGEATGANAYGVSGISTSSNGVYGQGLVGISGKSTLSGGNGVRGEATGANAYGVYGSSTSSTGVYGQGRIGLDGYSNVYKGIAIQGLATEIDGIGISGKSFYSVGIYGEGSTGVKGYSSFANGYGLFGEATGQAGIGVYGKAESADGVYAGVGVQGTGTNPGCAGVYGYSKQYDAVVGKLGAGNEYFAGDFWGPVFATEDVVVSDRRLKLNINEVTNAIDIIRKLRPKSYNFRNEDDYKLMHLPKGKHYGLIAQDVEEIFPDLVKLTTYELAKSDLAKEKETNATSLKSDARSTLKPSGYKALNYIEFIPIVIKAVQELDIKTQRIDELEKKAAEVDALRAEVAELRQMTINLQNGNKNTTSFSSAGYLDQNIPNPVSGTTIIRYHLPASSTSAKLIVTNAIGQLIKTMTLTNNEIGQVELNIKAFATGTYSYTLYVDGRKQDTKQFVIVR